MSAAPSPRGKATAATDVDSIMPLLFATIGNPSISFKKMAAMDTEKRSESSLEHKFRKWRQLGREIAAKNPEHASETYAAATPKKPRAAPTKKAANGNVKTKQPDVGEEEGAVDDEGDFAVVKHEGDDTVKYEVDENATTDCNKKRAISKDAENGDVAAKKAKVAKKGTAKVLKKPAAKARVSVSDDEDGSGQEEEVEAAPKAKGRAKAAPKSKTAANKGRKSTPFPAEDDGLHDRVPMKFEQEV